MQASVSGLPGLGRSQKDAVFVMHTDVERQVVPKEAEGATVKSPNNLGWILGYTMHSKIFLVIYCYPTFQHSSINATGDEIPEKPTLKLV